jgi:hypothetical protein
MHSLARLFCTASLFLMAGLSGSCAAPFAVTAGMAAAQAGSGAYTGGELRAARYATLDQTMEAVYATIDDLELEILTERTRTRSRYIMAKEPRGPEFKITVERKSRMATRSPHPRRHHRRRRPLAAHHAPHRLPPRQDRIVGRVRRPRQQ